MILSISVDLWKQILGMATLLLTLLSGVIVLLNNFVKEGILFSYKKLRDSEQINLINEISYSDEKGKQNYKNSVVFRAITGKQAPIHIVNLIFNCYDPSLALYIYSKAEGYIKFREGKLLRPNILDSNKIECRIIKFLLIFELIVSFGLLLLGLFAITYTLHNLPRLKSSKAPENVVFLGFVTLIFAVASSIVGLLGFNYSLNELTLLNKVHMFYNNHSQWNEAQGITELDKSSDL